MNETSLTKFSLQINLNVLVQMLLLHNFIYSISYLFKKCMNWNEACNFFINKTLKKQKAKREQTHPVCLHAVEKYEKLESVKTQ